MWFLFFLLLTILSESSALSTKSKKRALLNSISSSRRQGPSSASQKAQIFEHLADLEMLGVGRDRSIEGRWNLVWSGRPPQKGRGEPRLELEDLPALQFISNQLYSIFFKFAPQLAGSNSENLKDTRNEQLIDLERRAITNRVEIKSLPIPLTIIVEVECGARKADLVDVIFVRTRINGFVIPLPRPKGTLQTVYNDGDMRISKGGQGGLFVCSKMKL